MILIEGKKFACDTCIKGHRSSACKHTDRPLFEIQKKGRPITQCSHCRELRKTKQVHVKCQCGEVKFGKEESQPGNVKPLKKVPEAVYPAGVSTALCASIVLIPDPSSDSDQPGYSKSPACTCQSGGDCHCAVPRKVKRTRQKKAISVPTSSDIPSPMTTRPHLESTREYRPVLPKPSQTQNNHNHDGPVHVPSSTPAHGHVPRHHTHPDMLYSPYGRAYETSHLYSRPYEADLDFAGIESMIDTNSIVVTNAGGQSIPWNVFNATGGPSQSLCSCGESCACPGCFEHRGSSAAIQALVDMSASNGCVNPSTCSSCLECSVIIGSTSETSPTDIQNIDEWFRQLTAPSPLPSDGSQPLAYAVQQQMQTMTSTSLSQHGDSYVACGEWVHKQFNGASECCGGSCKCPPGLCSCASNCYGCGQNRSCECHIRGERGPLTFAVSGERGACCNGEMEDGSLMDTRGMFMMPQLPVAYSSSDARLDIRRSRSSSMSVSDGVGETYDGMQIGPTPSPVGSCCSVERTTIPATSFFASTDDINIL